MAKLGFGTGVEFSRISNIGELITVGVAPAAEYISYLTTLSAFVQVIPAAVDPGDIVFTAFYNGNPGQSAHQFINELKLQTPGKYTINYPDGVADCMGYIKRVSIRSVFDGILTIEVIGRLTGEFNFEGS